MSKFAELRRALDVEKSGAPADYAVTKAEDEERYTFGVMYVPNALDSDDEWADAKDLQKAAWNFFRSGQRMIKDTHTNRDIGELVELVSWPYEAEVEARLGDGTVHKYKLPANTVYAGVVWQPEAWALVKSGKLRGYSMGGKAVRMKEASNNELPRMRDMGVIPQKSAGGDKIIADEPVEKKGGDEIYRALQDDPVFKSEYARELARIHAARS